MIQHLHGRRRPYTQIGIRRLPCFRFEVCGNMAEYQWNVCADGNLYRPLCAQCDVALNAMVLRWMLHPDAQRLIEDYSGTKL
jgi:hypothetical protein